MKTQRASVRGFTLIELMIVVAIIGLLVAIAIPNFVRSRGTAQAKACIHNMRQMDEAIQQWALEHGQTTGTSVGMNDIAPYLKLTSSNTVAPCPAGGTYTLAPLGTAPSVTCSLGTTVTPEHVLP